MSDNLSQDIFDVCMRLTLTSKRGHVVIDYTNWRGERSTREIVPLGNWKLGSNEWHPQEQWMFLARDVAKGEDRWFAMSGIHSWRSV